MTGLPNAFDSPAFNGLNAQWTFSPGVISRVSREHEGAWRDWYVAEWPGREEREYTSYDAAFGYLISCKEQVLP